MSYVLVVDDEEPIRILLSRYLKRWGYEAREASSATEALEAMLAEPAAIILLDIKMPGHDGLWLAERVHARWSQTAIIMVTGVADPATVLKAKRLGAVDYIVKPFRLDLLREALRRAAGQNA